MNVDPNDIGRWLAIAQTIWLIGLSVVVWLRKPGTQAQESVKSLQEAMAQQTAALTLTMQEQHHNLDLRLKAVETDMKHMPTSEEMTRLAGEVRVVAEQTRAIAVTLDAFRGQMGRMEHFLMNEPKGQR